MIERPAGSGHGPRPHSLGRAWMEITHKRRSRLPAIAAQFLLGITGLALITFVCFQLGFGLARTGFAFVILIALVSLLGSFSASVVLSIIAAACLNYFFAPPLFEFRVDAPDDIERIAAFLTTSLVVTRADDASLSARRMSYAKSMPGWKRRSGSRMLDGGSVTYVPITYLFRTRFAGSSECSRSTCRSGMGDG